MVKTSLAVRVLGLSFLLLALPLILYVGYTFRSSYQNQMLESTLRLQDLGVSRAMLLAQLYDNDIHAIASLSDLLSIDQNRDNDLLTVLKSDTSIMAKLANDGGFAKLYYLTVNDDKRLICTASSDIMLIGQDFTDDFLPQSAIKKGASSLISHASEFNSAMLYVAKAIINPLTKEPSGVLVLVDSVHNLFEKIATAINIGYNVDFSIVSKDGIIIASSDNLLRLIPVRQIPADSELTPQEGELLLKPLPLYPGAFQMLSTGPTGLAVLEPIGTSGLNMLVDADEKSVFGPFQTAIARAAIVFGVLLLFGGVITIWLTIHVSKPMQQLCKVMELVGKGTLSTRFKAMSMGFEVNTLGEIFNHTIDSLQRNMDIVEVERLRREKLASELKIGHEIQKSLLPQSLPALPSCSVSARYIPAKEVSGDFYDVFTRDGKVILTVADASDKGISACLYSISLRSILRAYAMEQDDLALILKNTNNLFMNDTQAMGAFVTLFVAIYDPEKLTLTYSCCGHNPAFLCKSNGHIEPLGGQAMAMGVINFDKVATVTVQLEPNDVVFMYTDGVTEAMNEKHELFRQERLLEILRGCNAIAVDEISGKVLKAVETFVDSSPQSDDITILTLKAG